ncbi:5-oxoprolinase subunit PxpA [uncultured Winogradskyella sp.]|uniref:5-oxoprolinase subunit PxpA n=1 Tax=uncultured Winogradskyella sp. TaxID=395353 RepID=UPI00262084F3|nr:5-oxoprolinase subunit PxpA [uncultured Winogradskyella sp.]
MNTISLDINADVGEGLNNENELMPYVSSCNIACGGHAGNNGTMTEVVKLALKHKVKIGAHPSFPDKENFGRTLINISTADLYSSLKMQIEKLQKIINKENAYMHHIKPHGALYNLAAVDEKTAKVIIEVIKSMTVPIKLYAPYNSVIAKLADMENIALVLEAFADRNYNDDLSLVSRKNKHAILTDKHQILNQILSMVKHNKVVAINGVEVPIEASTFCIHGDTENATEILQFLNTELPKNRIQLKRV